MSSIFAFVRKRHHFTNGYGSFAATSTSTKISSLPRNTVCGIQERKNSAWHQRYKYYKEIDFFKYSINSRIYEDIKFKTRLFQDFLSKLRTQLFFIYKTIFWAELPLEVPAFGF